MVIRSSKYVGERVERVFPVWGYWVAVTCFRFDQVPDREVEHFNRGLFGCEVSAVAGDFLQPGVIDSMRFVLNTTRRSSGGNARDGTISGHAVRQDRAMAG